MPCRYHCEGDNSRWLGRFEDSRWNATWHDPGHVQEGGTPPWGCQLQRRSSGGQCIPLNAFSASMLVGLCIQGVTQETHVFFVPQVSSILSMSMFQTPKTTIANPECAWRSSNLWNTHIGSNAQTAQAVFGTACYMQLIVQVHVRVEIPTKLSNDERKIVEELQEIQSKKPVKKKGFSIFWAIWLQQLLMHCPWFVADWFFGLNCCLQSCVASVLSLDLLGLVRLCILFHPCLQVAIVSDQSGLPCHSHAWDIYSLWRCCTLTAASTCSHSLNWNWLKRKVARK